MPLPSPAGDESRDHFMSRCMADPVMNHEFPESDQRYAVCSQRWGDKGYVARAAGEELPLLARLAAHMEPAARRAFLAAIRAAHGVVDFGALVDAVRTGQVSQVEAAAQIERISPELSRLMSPVLGQTFSLGVVTGAEAIGLSPSVGYGFDLVNPESITWVRARGAELVTEVTDSVRSALRATLAAGIQAGMSPAALAREIREIVGLREDQALAVARFRDRLEADDHPEDVVDRRTAKYAEAQLRQRAMLIARTETITASSEGQEQLWQHAASSGQLDRARTRRVWLVTHDDRLDTEVCEPLDEAETTLDKPFVARRGKRKIVVMRPPAHPQCRCAVVLKFLDS